MVDDTIALSPRQRLPWGQQVSSRAVADDSLLVKSRCPYNESVTKWLRGGTDVSEQRCSDTYLRGADL